MKLRLALAVLVVTLLGSLAPRAQALPTDVRPAVSVTDRVTYACTYVEGIRLKACLDSPWPTIWSLTP